MFWANQRGSALWCYSVARVSVQCNWLSGKIVFEPSDTLELSKGSSETAKKQKLAWKQKLARNVHDRRPNNSDAWICKSLKSSQS